MQGVLPEVERAAGLFEVSISFADITVDKLEVGRALGYPDHAMPEYFDSLIDTIMLQLPAKCEIHAGYRLVDAEKPDDQDDRFVIGRRCFGVKKIVAARLKGAEQAACFVGTIGSPMETWSRELVGRGDPVLGHLVDTVASTAAESVADRLHAHIGCAMEKQGLHCTNRYSPGYCGWSVAEQHALFSFFPAGFCGVTLNESALMQPIKSVSGVVGIGRSVSYADYSCANCGNTECTYRAIRRARDRRKNEAA